MNSATSQALLRLNRAFYDRFADEFARSRTSEQPGWQRLLPIYQNKDAFSTWAVVMAGWPACWINSGVG
jgi:hypothetical protein